MQKFIIQHIMEPGATARITGQDARHICKVLRGRVGDTLMITNGEGADFSASITACTPEKIDLIIGEEIPGQTESPIDITLCTGMLKDKKMDLIIKHVTQLGITQWIPFFCDRSVPKPDTRRMEKRTARWQAIAQESLKQCGRSRLPQITLPAAYDRMLEHASLSAVKIAFWEQSHEPLEKIHSKKPASISILIGPEGGFTQQEIDSAQKHGFKDFSLGPRILRAETAAISSCTLVQHLFGDI